MQARPAIERFLASPGLGEATRRAYRFDLEPFANWLEARGAALDDVDARLLSDYAAELGRGRPRRLAPATIARRLASARSLIRFALGAEHVPDVQLSPRRPRRLPQAPKLPELERTLSALSGDEPLQLRNRALVELVYSAGLRSHEAVGLDLADVDFDAETVHVRGKGEKERVVPLGEEAAYRVGLYLRDGTAGARHGRGERAVPLCPRPPPGHEHAPPSRAAPAHASAMPSRHTCSRAAPTCA